MKVTIRSVDKALWEQAKHDCITEGKSLGELVNEGLELRQLIKNEHIGKALQKAREEVAEMGGKD